MEGIGCVIGATRLRGYRFVIREGKEEHVRKEEFVTVKENVSGCEVLGIVKEIVISNELLPDEFGRDLRLANLVPADGEYPVSTVKIIGCENGGGLSLPRYGIKPGTAVNLASDETLRNLLAQDEGRSAHVGTLATRESVPVRININELISRHCAVLAMTGAGKSYTVGVLVEELMKKRASVVIFDPHGEFKGVELDKSKVRVYGIEGGDRIMVDVGLLSAADYFNLIPDLTNTQKDLLDEVIGLAERFYDKYDLKILFDIVSLVYDIKKGDGVGRGEPAVFPIEAIKVITKKVGLSTIGALMRRIKRLERTGVFSMEGTPLSDIVSGNQLTVINLSEADERVSETIIAAITRRIFEARRRAVKGESDGEMLNTPTFLIVEEAHNFAPRATEERPALSRGILRKIAREGRKFGVGLCVVSQRPNKLDSDVLSQCNTQIIMKIMNPADQEYIRASVETVTEDIVRDLPSLSRGEAIIVGSAINFPVPVKIRERTTKVGGEDIDFVGVWNNGK